jgi:hypothetical protein
MGKEDERKEEGAKTKFIAFLLGGVLKFTSDKDHLVPSIFLRLRISLYLSIYFKLPDASTS